MTVRGRTAIIILDKEEIMRRGGIIQVSWVPPGMVHHAPVNGTMHDAVDFVAAHFIRHLAPGGWVGIAPIGRGFVVQSHTADGRIEGWRILRPASR